MSKKNRAHFNLIHTMMGCLPLELARTLYRCLLTETERVLKRAQPAAKNVCVDILTIGPLEDKSGETHYYSQDDYTQATQTLGDQWARATKTSRQALHMLAVLDDAIVMGKLRAQKDKYAYGSFDQAIATFDGEGGASDCLPNFSRGVSFHIEQDNTPKVVVECQDTDGVPVEPMGAANTIPDPVPEYSTPQEVQNYLVF